MRPGYGFTEIGRLQRYRTYPHTVNRTRRECERSSCLAEMVRIKHVMNVPTCPCSCPVSETFVACSTISRSLINVHRSTRSLFYLVSLLTFYSSFLGVCVLPSEENKNRNLHVSPRVFRPMPHFSFPLLLTGAPSVPVAGGREHSRTLRPGNDCRTAARRRRGGG